MNISSPEMSPGKAPALVGAATLTQVAEAVGVSRVAVSVVLNNSRSKVRVSETTRQRILDKAREMNYRPNVLARALNNHRTNIIGFHSVRYNVFNPLFPFYAHILQGLLWACEKHQKDFLIHGTFTHANEEDIYLGLLNGHIDSLVLYARETTPLTEMLVNSRLPVVTVADEVPGLPCITVDDHMGGQLLGCHLAEKGYRRILFWAPAQPLPSSIERRLSGLRAEAALYGLQVNVHHESPTRDFAAQVKQIVGRKARPEVIAAFSDYTAHGIIKALNSLGLQVPQDMAVTGFDGFEGQFGSSTGFTTIRAPWGEVAQTAISLLVQQCDGYPIPLLTQLPVELVVGDTT